MLPQPLIDALIVIGMFVLRIGVPLAIVVVIGGWLEKRLAPPAAGESKPRMQGARIIQFRPRQNGAAQPQAKPQSEPAKKTGAK